MSSTVANASMVTWYRGEVIGGSASKPGGGAIHDLGEGMYLTDRLDVAQQYAKTRASEQSGKQSVLVATFPASTLGRVLDLRTDSRWSEFFRTTPGGGRLLELMQTGKLNEIYGKTFAHFLQQYRIDLRQYDAVIGPEYVRGGNQLCILNQNKQPSELTKTIRSLLQPVSYSRSLTTPPPTQPATVRIAPPVAVGAPRSVTGRVMANQNSAAMLGVALGALIQWIGDKAIENRIARELETTHQPYIQAALARGHGVMVILRFHEWEQPDFNGMRARQLHRVDVTSGPTKEDAMGEWNNRLKGGPPKGWRSFEQYVWIPAE